VGYPRAAKLIDQMEERGIVGKSNGSKPREVLITKEQLQEMQMREQGSINTP
jgi:S-DNA-T family DNA segregation ATPase FtsK/SpoIIIE